MYGTLRGALAGRKIAFDRDSFKATVDGRISGIGNTIRIKSIHVHYDLAVPPEAREATERALPLHPQGCPTHPSCPQPAGGVTYCTVTSFDWSPCGITTLFTPVTLNVVPEPAAVVNEVLGT